MFLFYKKSIKYFYKILGIFSITVAVSCFFPHCLQQVRAEGETAKIHVLTLKSNTNAILLETRDEKGNPVFGMVDSGEDWDYPDGSDPRYPWRNDITRRYGYDQEVVSYLDSVGVTKGNLIFYVATHPHSDHIGTADTIVYRYAPKRVYLLPYQDSDISDPDHLWDNQYVYDQLMEAIAETKGVQLIQNLSENAASVEEGKPEFTFGDFQIQIVNYEQDYLIEPKSDANQFCMGVIASANGHRAFLTSDIVNDDGDADRIVEQYDLHQVDFMTSNHHGISSAVDVSYLDEVHPAYFIQTGIFHYMSLEMLSELNTLGAKVYSTAGYTKEVPAIITDFSGLEVTCNLDQTTQIYTDAAGELRAYTDGKPCSGLFSYAGRRYYAKEEGILYRSTKWLDFATSTLYTFDQNGCITEEEKPAGWIWQDKKWYYFGENHELCKGWLDLAGRRYYLDETGAMVTGWLCVDGETYYLDKHGVMMKGWLYSENNYYWFRSDGTLQYGWMKIDGKTYYLDEAGAMVTGWLHTDGQTYYLDENGEMVTGWLCIKDHYYWFNADGEQQYGWQYINRTAYYLDDDGVMVTGWLYLDGKYYWFNANGEQQYGWQQIEHHWYYFIRDTGEMYTKGWLKAGNDWYFLQKDGVMKSNTSFEEKGNLYFMKPSGAMYKNQWLLWNKKYYALDASGAARKEQWYFEKGTWYYLNADGSMQTGWRNIQGKTYYFYSWGGMASGTTMISGKTYQFKKDGALRVSKG